MAGVFTQLSLIILLVFVISLIMRILKQPLIIGYIISGIIAGPFFLGLLPNIEAVNVFSEFGIAFLLFIVGLHLSPKVIKEVGKISLITGIGQIIFTAAIGYFIGVLLGFKPITSFYIAMALTFSSTIIIMKLLSDKNDLETLYGKISIGFLLVQDLVAILALIIISSMSSGENPVSSIGITMLKGIFSMAVLFPISVYVLPKFENFFAKSQELLFVFSIAWGLGISALFLYLGFSIEVGALLAGVLLSVSPYSLEISSKLKPLRDFFIIPFFLLLGAQMVINNVSEFVVPAIVFSLLIFIGNPLIVMVLMGFFGYTRKTGFLAGLTVAQIGEFSLIVVALGAKVGHISNEILSLVTMTGLITIATCTYMVIYSDKIYSKISEYLSVFERKNIREKKVRDKNIDAVLFGYNRIGFNILNSLKKIKKTYVVVDYNPDVISNLSRLRVPSVYGDVDDENLLKELPLEKIKIAISTIPEFESNEFIIKKIRELNKDAIIIVRSHQIDEALELYELGADYVLTPHFLGGEYVAKMIREEKFEKEKYAEEKKKHLEMLNSARTRGQKHPFIEKN